MENKDLKSVKVNFNLRSDSENEKNTALNCVIRWDKQKLVISNVERIEPKFWNKDSQKAKTFPGYAEFNTRLENIKTGIKKVYRVYLNDNFKYPTVNELRELVKNKLAGKEPEKKIPQTLFSYIPKFIANESQKENKKTQRKIAPVTIRIYKQGFRLLQEYAKNRNKLVDFDTVNLAFYEDFKSFLTYNKGFAKNTIGKHIRTLKRFLNDADSKGIYVNPDYKHQNFTGMTENIDNIYLNEFELEQIASLDLSNNFKLDRVRDLFLVGAWTGLRFSDFANIPKKSIDLNRKLITITMQKTVKPVVIPIHKTVLAILKKYRDKTENSLPPPLSNAKMNRHLKDVAELADLTEGTSKTKTIAGKRITINYKKCELVCTHTARRSFATNSYKMGIPIYAIMGITGHTSEKTFKNYIKVDNTEHAQIIQTFWTRQELKKVD